MTPIAPLEISTPMCRANLLHAEDLGKSGETGHQGADGSRAAQRLRNNGGVIAGGGRVSEGIEFGPWTDGADFVVALIVGDGEKSRTHRKILLDPASGACGVSVAVHKDFGSVCVVTLAPNCARVDKNTMSPGGPNHVNHHSNHQRNNTLVMAQSMSLPSILESSQEEEEDKQQARRNTMHRAANSPLGGVQ